MDLVDGDDSLASLSSYVSRLVAAMPLSEQIRVFAWNHSAQLETGR